MRLLTVQLSTLACVLRSSQTKISSSIPYSQTPYPTFLPNVEDQFLHPTGKLQSYRFESLYFWIAQGNTKYSVTKYSRCSMDEICFLTLSCIQFSCVNVVFKHINFVTYSTNLIIFLRVVISSHILYKMIFLSICLPTHQLHSH